MRHGIGGFRALRWACLAVVVGYSAYGQENWQFFITLPNVQVCCVTRDASGAVYEASGTEFSNFPVTAGAYQTSFSVSDCAGYPGFPQKPLFVPCPHGVVAKYSPSGDSIIWATFLGGSGTDTIRSMVLDPSGNEWVAGDTTSQDFPVTSDAMQKTVSGHFLSELSPDGSQLLYSTYTNFPEGDFATTLTVGADGSIYVVGTTNGLLPGTADGQFQTTPGAYASAPVAGENELYAVKFDSAAKRVVYAALIGPVFSHNAALVDSSGVLYIGGSTADPSFPVTPGVYSHRSLLADIFVTAVNPDGSDLVFSTVIGGSGDDSLSQLLRDDSGNLYLAGGAGDAFGIHAVISPDIPVTRDAAQPSWGSVILMKLSRDASQLLYSSYLGRDGLTAYGRLGGSVDQMKLSHDGKLHILWVSDEPDIPISPGSYGPCYPNLTSTEPTHWSYVRLRSDLKSIEYATAGPAEEYEYPYYFDTSGIFYVQGTGSDFFDVLDVSQATQPGPACMVDSVTQGEGPVAPGLLMSIRGLGIGADEPTPVAVDSSGDVASLLAGSQVLFDGIPAPILFTGPSRIDVVVPFGVATSGETTVTVLQDGVSLGTLTNALQPSLLRLFSTDGTGFGAAFWNQDGTPNGPNNPANVGDILTLYLTGAGQMAPQLADGTIPSVPSSVPVNALSVFYIQCPIVYAGDAPGQVEGVMQVNCQLQQSGLVFAVGDGIPASLSTIRNVVFSK